MKLNNLFSFSNDSNLKKSLHNGAVSYCAFVAPAPNKNARTSFIPHFNISQYDRQ